jgi:hypothetical protein
MAGTPQSAQFRKPEVAFAALPPWAHAARLIVLATNLGAGGTPATAGDLGGRTTPHDDCPNEPKPRPVARAHPSRAGFFLSRLSHSRALTPALAASRGQWPRVAETAKRHRGGAL